MKRLLLAGGGHAHLHLLRQLARGERRYAGTDIVLVSPYPRQVYSGMLPGWIAGHYRLDQCVAPLRPLAHAAGVRYIEDRLIGVDAARRLAHCAHQGELGYDVLSLDVGAEIDLAALVATPLLPIRPIECFIESWPRYCDDFARAGRARVAVVGAGAAGVELVLAVAYRLSRLLGPGAAEISLVEGHGLLRGHGAAVVARVVQTLADSGIRRLRGPARGSYGGLEFADGSRQAFDCIIAATGVMAPTWLATSGLALAADGFVAVGSGQQSLSHDEVFAGGDVASRTNAPHAKSGVYAVRAGPVLAENLAHRLAGTAIVPYRPQQRSLYLLATGPRCAIASWGRWSAQGAWVWRWKDWIDRRFMKQYAADTTIPEPDHESAE